MVAGTVPCLQPLQATDIAPAQNLLQPVVPIQQPGSAPLHMTFKDVTNWFVSFLHANMQCLLQSSSVFDMVIQENLDCVSTIEDNITLLCTHMEQQKEYSRRNATRTHKEAEGDNNPNKVTNWLVLQVVTDVSTIISLQVADKSRGFHPLQVKFTIYHTNWTAKKYLQGYIFINRDLSPYFLSLAYEARPFDGNLLLPGTWVYENCVHDKTTARARGVVVSSMAELEKVVSPAGSVMACANAWLKWKPVNMTSFTQEPHSNMGAKTIHPSPCIIVDWIVSSKIADVISEISRHF